MGRERSCPAEFEGRCPRCGSVRNWVLAGLFVVLVGCATAPGRTEDNLEQARMTEAQCSETDRAKAGSVTSLTVKRVDPEYIRVHVGKGLGDERLAGARVALRLPADWTVGVLVQATRCSQAAFLLRGTVSLPMDYLWEPGTWIDVGAMGGIGSSREATLVLKTVTGDAAERLLERVRAFAIQR